mmetsp:Transcript_29579/g.40006  ORF Transcript_29579/g.40006 Transcript_29579/m.40006 type:complete len:524 (-) Transcript_29579:9-1580(-)
MDPRGGKGQAVEKSCCGAKVALLTHGKPGLSLGSLPMHPPVGRGAAVAPQVIGRDGGSRSLLGSPRRSAQALSGGRLRLLPATKLRLDGVRVRAERGHVPHDARLAVEARRRRDRLVDVSGGHLDGHADQRGMLREAAHAVHLAERDALLLELGDQVLPVELHEAGLDDLVQLRAVLAPLHVGGEALVLEQLRTLQHVLAELLELTLVLNGDEDGVTPRLVVPVRLDGWVTQAMADRGALSVSLVVEEGDGEPVRQAAEERRIDMAALTGVPDVHQALQHGRMRVHPHGDVGRGHTAAHGFARHARKDADAGLRLDQHVVGLHVPVAARVLRVPVARQVDRDQLGELLAQVCGAEAAAGRGAGRHVLHEDIGLLDDAVEQVLVLFFFDVHAQGLLAAVQPHGVRRVLDDALLAVLPRAEVVVAAREVALAVVALDLDDTRAGIREARGAEGRRHRLLHGEHEDALQGPHLSVSREASAAEGLRAEPHGRGAHERLEGPHPRGQRRSPACPGSAGTGLSVLMES